MVKDQLVAREIRDKRVLEAMGRVPRERFFPEDEKDLAYADGAFPIGSGQTISQPYIVALMTELLGLEGGEKVLEIGTGSGYQAAVLAELGGEVYSIERLPELAEKAKKLLVEELKYRNLTIITGDGTKGLPSQEPFDAVIVTAAGPKVPEELTDQLSEKGGRLVIPVGDRTFQTLYKITRHGDELTVEKSSQVVFVPLIGSSGWKAG